MPTGGGPQAWWTQPGGADQRAGLDKAAPGGYYYDPVKMSYVKKPEQLGLETAAYNKAAGSNPDLPGSGVSGGGFDALAGLGSYGGGFGSYGGGQSPAPTAQIPNVAPIDNTAAHAAAFGRAKDEAGNTANAALTGLTGELQRRGLGGAGYEAGQIGHTLARDANQIGAASRAEAESSFQEKQREAELNYQGSISQRGQDIGRETTLRGQDLSAGTAARGQDLQLLMEKLRMRQSQAMNGLQHLY